MFARRRPLQEFETERMVPAPAACGFLGPRWNCVEKPRRHPGPLEPCWTTCRAKSFTNCVYWAQRASRNGTFAALF